MQISVLDSRSGLENEWIEVGLVEIWNFGTPESANLAGEDEDSGGP